MCLVWLVWIQSRLHIPHVTCSKSNVIWSNKKHSSRSIGSFDCKMVIHHVHRVWVHSCAIALSDALIFVVHFCCIAWKFPPKKIRRAQTITLTQSAHIRTHGTRQNGNGEKERNRGNVLCASFDLNEFLNNSIVVATKRESYCIWCIHATFHSRNKSSPNAKKNVDKCIHGVRIPAFLRLCAECENRHKVVIEMLIQNPIESVAEKASAVLERTVAQKQHLFLVHQAFHVEWWCISRYTFSVHLPTLIFIFWQFYVSSRTREHVKLFSTPSYPICQCVLLLQNKCRICMPCDRCTCCRRNYRTEYK